MYKMCEKKKILYVYPSIEPNDFNKSKVSSYDKSP